MDRVAVFVDAGYLFAAGSLLLSGVKQPRGLIDFRHEEASDFLGDLAAKSSGLPLLRIYWYDGTSSGPTSQQTDLANCRNVKVRLGIVNAVGAQKGVDSLLVTDLINLSRNHSISDAVVLAGDEDLRVGVQQAQEFGVKVHLVGICPQRKNQSNLLMQEADILLELSSDDLSSFMKVRETSAPELPDSAGIEEKIAGVARHVAESLDPNERTDLVASLATNRGMIPRPLDALLVTTLGKVLERGEIPQRDRIRLRQEFKDALASLDLAPPS